MSTILVWVLITAGSNSYDHSVQYSPAHATKESCEFMQKQLRRGQCVGMYIFKQGEK